MARKGPRTGVPTRSTGLLSPVERGPHRAQPGRRALALIALAAAVGAVPSAAAWQPPVAGALLRELADRSAALKDYEVVVECWVPVPGRKDRYQSYLLEFLRGAGPAQGNMFRKNVREGREDYDEFLIRQDGSVRARRDDFLRKNFPVNLRRDDRRLRDAEGIWLRDSDLASMAGRLTLICEKSTSRAVSEVSEAELQAELRPLSRALRRADIAQLAAGAYRLSMEYRADLEQAAAVSLLLSRKHGLPLLYVASRGGQRLMTLVFSRYRLNTGKKPVRFRF